MNTLGSFLESSSIHGLSYISTSKKFFKLFWICIVFTGFSTAGLLINQAFQSWADSPVSTAIETRPISELTFPKVTVCPPKNTFTDLNHELMMAENITIDEEDRKKLLYFAMDLLQDQLYEEFMFNLSIVHEDNRYSNWYNGYTDIALPFTKDMTNYFEYTGNHLLKTNPKRTRSMLSTGIPASHIKAQASASSFDTRLTKIATHTQAKP